ncbi:hypothetical protein ACFVZ3_04960 [Kitasatospora purpeofusca]
MLQSRPVRLFVLVGRHVVEGGVEPLAVVLRDPLEHGSLDLVEVPSRS